ncbi:hypothetical protein HYR54_03745 [Candidatus Acetothermia bacterium]|nr:hypothetical protein [Candidatus Acetothermia bacterium]MBI3460869.1 hypothetical protein [Candidatus Acetothermia bacterium]MBI3660838.1 hypothetical protein [Candidatus Acetothermia bacterium]
MTIKNKKKLSSEEIDQIVVAQANDDSAWEKPIRARKAKPASLAIPAELAARAAFLARLHKAKDVGEWLARIIQERIELEEVAFAEAKRELAERNGS